MEFSGSLASIVYSTISRSIRLFGKYVVAAIDFYN